jgi:hypothetical protein
MMEQELRVKFDIPVDWNVQKGETKEKERINQSTETTEFTATSPDGSIKRIFIHTNFCDHEGSEKSWRETTS